MPEDTEHEQIPKKYLIGFYAMLLAVGLIIYLTWGIMYGSWNIFERENLGIYAITVIMVGFGIVGILLYTMNQKKE
jgi:hypothetical protein